ncbi:hypothetical protein D3C85_1019080 [compost metagenome]
MISYFAIGTYPPATVRVISATLVGQTGAVVTANVIPVNGKYLFTVVLALTIQPLASLTE